MGLLPCPLGGASNRTEPRDDRTGNTSSEDITGSDSKGATSASIPWFLDVCVLPAGDTAPYESHLNAYCRVLEDETPPSPQSSGE